MNLSSIITANESHTQSILIETMLPYKKSLLTYYSNYFGSRNEPMLMVTDVFNAAQYGKIVPANDFQDAIAAYLDDYNCSDENSENFAAYETICFNSIPLSKL